MGILEKRPIEWQSYLWEQSRSASSSDIERVERELEVYFPDDYRAIVIENQGKVPKQNLFDFLENGHKTTTVMGVLFHFLEDKSEAGYYS
jgi:cell wall assembly regulator SMI1